MIILIDAYNYIKSIESGSFVDDAAIKRWIQVFIDYVVVRGNQVILVFDAGPSFFRSEESHGGVKVIWAGQHKTADDEIKDWIRKHQGQDVLLVSSDRQVRDFGKNMNIVSISSQDFYKIFTHIMHQQEQHEQKIRGTIHKTQLEKHEELDILMEAGSRGLVVKKEHADCDLAIRVRDGKKASKTDKVLMKKIDKL